jgi:hypothetical protein
MKITSVLRIAIGVTAAPVVNAQNVRPASLPYMTRGAPLKDFSRFENPRLSADGRWLAFDARHNPPGRNIWVVPAKGGEPIQITTGDHTDLHPMWSASGDRLVFQSERTGGLMTIAVDPVTGHPIGSVKRVTVDSVSKAAFDVSPDGAFVAYAALTPNATTELRIVPINGGPARTIASMPGEANNIRYDRAGQYLYFTHNPGAGSASGGSPERTVSKVPVAGGAVAIVWRVPPGLMGIQLDPVANRVIVRDHDHAYVLTLSGDSIATIPWMQGWGTVSALGFTPDGSGIITAFDATRTSLDVIPLDGGPVKHLTDSSSSPWPDFWVGNRILFSDKSRTDQDYVTLDGKKGHIDFDLRKMNGGIQPKIFDDEPFADGYHWAVKAVMATSDTALYVYDERTGTAREVARSIVQPGLLGVSAGSDDYKSWFGSDYVYKTLKGSIAEIHAVTPSGVDRLLQSLPNPETSRVWVAFAPGRVARSYQSGDSVHLDVTVGSGAPVHVLTVAGSTMGEIAFSPNGNTLYADVTVGKGSTAHTRGGFFPVANANALSTPPRWVDLIDKCYHPTWLPNGDAVLENGSDPSNRTSMWRIPAHGAPTAQIVSQRESATFWDYIMSPDGKAVVVPAEHYAGVDLWRLDLSKVSSKRAPK